MSVSHLRVGDVITYQPHRRTAGARPSLGWVVIALADREARMVLVGLPAGLVAAASLAQLLRALRRPAAQGDPTTSAAAVARPSAT